MLALCLVATLAVAVYGTTHPLGAVPEDFDCPMRQLALEFAVEIQPFLSKDQLQEIADALNGAEECVNRSCVSVPSNWKKEHREAVTWDDLNEFYESDIFVDFDRGNDNNDGSILSSFKHLDTAIEFARLKYGKDIEKRIIMREGVHYLRKTIDITPNDNNLLITNYNKENAQISGGVPLNCKWSNNNVAWKEIPYGIPPPAGNSTDGTYVYLGKFNSYNDCLAKVKIVYKVFGFATFTYHDSTHECYGRIGYRYTLDPHEKSGTTTGLLQNIYECDVGKANNSITDIKGLRINGDRAIRARYPNGNPEVYPCGFCSKLIAKSWLSPTCTPKPDKEYNPSQPDRATSNDGEFQHYQLGVGGCCDEFIPNAGYWCGNNTQGGSAATYSVPGGLTYDKTVLPNAPYKTVDGGVVQAWRPSHWSSWMFLMDPKGYDAKSGIVKFLKGGFQGGRGDNVGAEFYVENIREELDYPTEFYFNKTTKTLYYFNNGTGPPPSNLKFEITNLKVLLNYTGTMKNPVKNQVVRGLTFKDSQITYLDPHGMPSGGDWALQRTGAVYLDGVYNINISSNLFTRLDGNAISINRYAREVAVYKNEIVWQGDSAVTAWGDTQNISFSDGTTMGWDGTTGTQPRGVEFTYNLVHEIGIWEKQSSMWFQAKSCSNLLENNIFFNGPRAGINFNDGFGGNSTIKKNLVFNTCRESGDHGPFNSWDRQVYVTKILNGTPSVIKDYDHIIQNMMIANYHSTFAVDNDDGSSYYDTHNNFLVYSTKGMKNDGGGHDNHGYNNIYGYITDLCFSINGQSKGHQDEFYNNTCVVNVNDLANYGRFDCQTQSSRNQWPKMGGNRVYSYGDKSKVGLCNLPESAFQSTNPGIDDGTVIYGKPNNADLIAQAKALIFA